MAMHHRIYSLAFFITLFSFTPCLVYAAPTGSPDTSSNSSSRVLKSTSKAAASTIGARASRVIPRPGVASDAIEVGTGCTGSSTANCGRTIRKVGVTAAVGAAAVPATVAAAGAIGATASTGTAIATLSGAAATSATLAAVGSGGSAALAAVGIPAAPAFVSLPCRVTCFDERGGTVLHWVAGSSVKGCG